MDKLRIAFENYLKLAQSLLIKRIEQNKPERQLHLLSNEPRELKTLVSNLEEREEFVTLLEETKCVFEGRKDEILFLVQITLEPHLCSPQRMYSEDCSVLGNEEMCWRLAVHNVLCRLGSYSDIYENIQVDMAATYLDYCTSFQQEELTTIKKDTVSGLDMRQTPG